MNTSLHKNKSAAYSAKYCWAPFLNHTAVTGDAKHTKSPVPSRHTHTPPTGVSAASHIQQKGYTYIRSALNSSPEISQISKHIKYVSACHKHQTNEHTTVKSNYISIPSFTMHHIHIRCYIPLVFILFLMLHAVQLLLKIPFNIMHFRGDSTAHP